MWKRWFESLRAYAWQLAQSGPGCRTEETAVKALGSCFQSPQAAKSRETAPAAAAQRRGRKFRARIRERPRWESGVSVPVAGRVQTPGRRAKREMGTALRPVLAGASG